ncbi:MAG: DUF4115 domain-containing protein [SAR86 cluster bacterium]|jgi:cytoskeleton protein RodZ|nr:DUF4115 domain-containing protein [SAR86 cluster bacterium]
MSEDEKPSNPGHLLREARRKKRRKYKKLASELSISEQYLEALEENNFSIMAGPTYVKGYLRAYSKKLDLDPELVLEAYERYLKDQRKKEKKAEKKEKKVERKRYFPLLYIVVVILIIVFMLLILLPDNNAEIQKDNESNFVPMMEKGITEENSFNLTSESASPEKLAFRENTEIIEKEPSGFIEDVSTVRTEKTNDINTIRLNFSGTCWIEIMDRKTVLEYKLAKAGTSIYLEGEGPFKIIIGHSKRAELFYNDTQINLATTTNDKTNVSCLVLPKGKCDEFAQSN